MRLTDRQTDRQTHLSVAYHIVHAIHRHRTITILNVPEDIDSTIDFRPIVGFIHGQNKKR